MRPLGVELAAMLASRGVDTVFGIPGVHNIEMYRGVEEAGIRHVLARHEQGAGFMADGYARASGQPGVCFVITGPGLTNIMTPMGQAYSDSVPMLVISTCLDESAARRGQLHQMRDQEGAARTVCAWSETARTPEAAFALVDRAMAEFFSRRHRPKHLSIPIAVMGGPAAPHPAHPDEWPQRPGAAPLPSQPLRERLAASRRPLFIFGGGARNGPARLNDVLKPNWLEPFRKLNAASFTTYAGKGMIPPDFPLHFGSYLARAGSADVLASADLIVAVGTEMAEVDFWRTAHGHNAPLVRIDIDPSVLGDGLATMPILADAEHHLTETLLTMEPLETDWTRAEVSAVRSRWRSEVDAERPGIVPVCDALSSALPANTMIFSDMTQFAYAALEVWEMQEPGLWHHPSGFGTLGYALPAAIGGALGHDGPVLAIAGDYGFQYTIQELGTAAELGLSLPILLWDNNALGEIRDNMVAAQIAPVAVSARNPRWDRLAEAYGCGYAEPASVEALCEAVNAAFTAGRPTIIRATPGIAG